MIEARLGKKPHLCSPNLVSMRKSFMLFFGLFITILSATAQRPELMAKSSSNGLYLEHKIAPKESFFAVGRLYNINPKTIAAYNKLDITKGLTIGQQIKIPLTDTNFTQKGNKGTPLYHKIGEKEGLMKVSTQFNDVTLETLRNWNGLADNNVAPGAKVVVGFLLSKEFPSVTLGTKTTDVKKTEVVKTEPVKEEVTPVVKPTKEEVKTEKELAKAEKEVLKEEPKKPEPIVASPVVGNGFFKYYFDQQVKVTPLTKDASVTSGIFKTTSGWVDTKYYLLVDGVQPGTIIKVINPANNKAIYAKVLGEMSGIRLNDGLNIRLSSAGASALEVTDQDKFIVKVNY